MADVEPLAPGTVVELPPADLKKGTQVSIIPTLGKDGLPPSFTKSVSRRDASESGPKIEEVPPPPPPPPVSVFPATSAGSELAQGSGNDRKSDDAAATAATEAAKLPPPQAEPNDRKRSKDRSKQAGKSAVPAPTVADEEHAVSTTRSPSIAEPVPDIASSAAQPGGQSKSAAVPAAPNPSAHTPATAASADAHPTTVSGPPPSKPSPTSIAAAPPKPSQNDVTAKALEASTAPEARPSQASPAEPVTKPMPTASASAPSLHEPLASAVPAPEKTSEPEVSEAPAAALDNAIASARISRELRAWLTPDYQIEVVVYPHRETPGRGFRSASLVTRGIGASWPVSTTPMRFSPPKPMSECRSRCCGLSSSRRSSPGSCPKEVPPRANGSGDPGSSSVMRWLNARRYLPAR